MKFFPLLVLVALLSSCSWITRKDLAQVDYQEKKELVVLTRNTPISYYEDRTGQVVGFEHDLAVKFAKEANVKIRFVLKKSIEEIQEGLLLGQGHVGMAGIVGSPILSEKFTFSPKIIDVDKKLLCHSKFSKARLKSKKKTIKTVFVSENEELEEFVKKSPLEFTNFEFKNDHESSFQDWSRRVINKEVDCLLVDSFLWDLNKASFADLKLLKSFHKGKMIWLMNNKQKRLHKDLSKWFEQIIDSRLIKKTKNRYFSVASDYDPYEIQIFLKRIQSRLPKLMSDFKAAGEKYNFDWRLLAAMAYQESHWNPESKSPTGVRGLMMLTLKTAEELGVTNRLDVKQSLFGGTKYLRRLVNLLPVFLPEEERLKFALASYNVGLAHLQDARKLAVGLGKNANKWEDLKQVLPLLSQRRYYSQLKHGFARGREPVTYLSRIYRYYDRLKFEFSLEN